MNTIKDYAVQVYWDDRAGYFVAEIPEIPTCAADGATQIAALANLEETFAVLKEAYVEGGLSIPAPKPLGAITVQRLCEVADLIKVSRLAEIAGIPGQTLATKLKRSTPLNVSESQQIMRALKNRGVVVSSSEFSSRGANYPTRENDERLLAAGEDQSPYLSKTKVAKKARILADQAALGAVNRKPAKRTLK